jgi:hypothetical protein
MSIQPAWPQCLLPGLRIRESPLDLWYKSGLAVFHFWLKQHKLDWRLGSGICLEALRARR